MESRKAQSKPQSKNVFVLLLSLKALRQLKTDVTGRITDKTGGEALISLKAWTDLIALHLWSLNIIYTKTTWLKRASKPSSLHAWIFSLFLNPVFFRTQLLTKTNSNNVKNRLIHGLVISGSQVGDTQKNIQNSWTS